MARDVVLKFTIDAGTADAAVKDLAKSVGKLSLSVKALKDWTDKLNAASTAASTSTTKLAGALGALGTVANTANSALATTAGLVGNITTVMTGAATSTGSYATALRSATTATRPLSRIAGTLSTQTRSVSTAFTRANTAVDRMSTTVTSRGLKSLSDLTLRMGDTEITAKQLSAVLVKTLPDAMSSMKNATVQLTRTVADLQKSLSKIQSTDFAKAVSLLKDLGKQRLSRVHSEFTRINSSARVLGNSLRVVSGVFVSLGNSAVAALSRMNLALTRLFSGVRQIGQAFLNLGITANIFIGLPLQRAFSSMLDSVLDFDDGVSKVRKTVDLTAAEINQDLVPGLRQMALVLPVSTAELAELASIAGQLGINSVPQILALTEVGSKLGIASDLTAAQSVEALGRIATAYGVAGDELIPYVNSLAAVLTRLGNETAATEGDIVEALSNTIATAKLLEIPIQDVAALVAGLRESGLSAEESGTALRRAFENMVDNLDVIIEATGATGAMEAQLRSLASTDPVEFFIQLIEAINNIEDPVERMTAAFEILEVRGLRALSSPAENLRKELARANDEWERGTALNIEFKKALQSTRNQMQLASNALNEAALTLGDTFLPVLNRVLQFVAAGGRILAEELKKLPDRTKLLIVAVAAGIPILLAFGTVLGSLLFAMNIAAQGFLTSAAAVGALLAQFAPAIIAVTGLGAAMVAAAVAANSAFSEFVNGIIPALDRLISDVEEWGAGIMRALALGILRGAKAVISAVVSVANVIASFFRAQSPPEKGPLSQIVQWGKNLMDTFLAAFQLADFDLLKDAASIVRDVLETFVTEGLIGETELIPMVLSFREGLAELIKVFNETGQIADGLLANITAPLGEAADEVEKLIRLTLAYNKAQADLDRIKKRREDVGRATDREIRAIALRTDLTAAERLALIRNAKARQRDMNESLDLEEQAAEEKRDNAKDELEQHKALLGALRDEMDLRREQLELLQKLAEQVEDIKEKKEKEPKEEEGLGFGLEFGGAKEQAEEFFGAVEGGFQDVLKSIDEAGDALRAFFRGLTTDEPLLTEVVDTETGLPFSATPLPPKTVADAFKFGRRIRDVFVALRDTILSARDALQEAGMEMGKFFSGENSGVDLAVDPVIKQRLKEIASLILSLAVVKISPTLLMLLKGIGSLGGVVAKGALIVVLGGFIQGLIDNRDQIEAVIDKLLEPGKEGDSKLGNLFQTVAGALLVIYDTATALGILLAETGTATILNLLGEPGDWNAVADALERIVDNIGTLFGLDVGKDIVASFLSGLTGKAIGANVTPQPGGVPGELISTAMDQTAFEAGRTLAQVLEFIQEKAGEAATKLGELRTEIRGLSEEDLFKISPEATPLLDTIVRLAAAFGALDLILAAGGLSARLKTVLPMVTSVVNILLPTFATIAKGGMWAFLSGFLESAIKHLPAIIGFIDYILGETTSTPAGANGFVEFLRGFVAELKAMFEVLASLGFLAGEAIFTGPGSQDTRNAIDRLRDSLKSLIDLQKEVPAEGLVFVILFGRTIAGAALKLGAFVLSLSSVQGALWGLLGILGRLAAMAIPVVGIGLIVLLLDKILFGGQGIAAVKGWLDGAGQDIQDAVTHTVQDIRAYFAGLTGNPMPIFLPPPQLDILESAGVHPTISPNAENAFRKGQEVASTLFGGRLSLSELFFTLVFGVRGPEFATEFDNFLDVISGLSDRVILALKQFKLNVESFMRGFTGQPFLDAAQLESALQEGLQIDDANVAFMAGMTVAGRNEGQSFLGWFIRTLFGLDDGSGETEAETAGETLGTSFIEGLRAKIEGSVDIIFGVLAGLFDAAFGPRDQGKSLFQQITDRGVEVVTALADGMNAAVGKVGTIALLLGTTLASGLVNAVRDVVFKLAALPGIGFFFGGAANRVDLLAKELEAAVRNLLGMLDEGTTTSTTSSTTTQGGGRPVALKSLVPTGPRVPFIGAPLLAGAEAAEQGVTVVFNNPVIDSESRLADIERSVSRIMGKKASVIRRLGGLPAS